MLSTSGGCEQASTSSPTNPLPGKAEFRSVLAAHPSVYGTHHIGASTEQAQQAIADGVVEVIAGYEAGHVVNCVNLETRPRGTCAVVVRHSIGSGSCPEVLGVLQSAAVNVEQMDNRVLLGGASAVASLRTRSRHHRRFGGSDSHRRACAQRRCQTRRVHRVSWITERDTSIREGEMSERAINFSAGPCTLPLSVLEEAQAEFVDFGGLGMSLIEMSHRSKAYQGVQDAATDLAREVFEAPDDFDVLFLGGGATLQFAMVAMNLLGQGRKGAYVNSGAWGGKALEDATHHGDVYSAWDGAESGYTRMPADAELDLQSGTRYLHITSNETIGGIRFAEFPDVGVPLVGDMSSDYMSRPVPWERFDLIYGGAQKNLGPAGVDITFIRRSILAKTNRDLAAYLRYDIHAAKGSMYNTPPVFTHLHGGQGAGLDEGQRRSGRHGGRPPPHKSGMIYEALDGSGGFYRSPVEVASRSHMNVVFRLPSEELERPVRRRGRRPEHAQPEGSSRRGRDPGQHLQRHASPRRGGARGVHGRLPDGARLRCASRPFLSASSILIAPSVSRDRPSTR